MFEDAVTTLRTLASEYPSLAGVVATILDVRERRGRLPSRLTVDADEAAASALVTVLSARAVTAAARGRVKLDLGLADRVCRDQLGVALEAVLYAALERNPRDLAAERADIVAALARGLANICGQTDASRAFLAAELAEASETRRIALELGAEVAIAEAGLLVRAIDAALTTSEPTRVANFAARVLGDSKALATGSDRSRRLRRALLEHHESTFRAVYIGGDVSERAALRLALEVNGIVRDEATLTAYCFGPLVYRKGGETFDHVRRHALLGEPLGLTLAQLRGAAVAELSADRVLVIENQTPFLDYIDHIQRANARSRGGRSGRELVVLSRGQANWAVIQLLRMASRAGVPIAHTGDLDRSGVLILRSLEDRLFCRVDPVAMDVTTHRRFRDRARVLTSAERQRLRSLCERDVSEGTCHDLLREIDRTGLWIEQEHIFGEMVLGRTRHAPTL